MGEAHIPILAGQVSELCRRTSGPQVAQVAQVAQAAQVAQVAGQPHVEFEPRARRTQDPASECC